MSANDPVNQPVPSVLQVIREEVMPRVPWRAAALWGIALGATFVIREVFDILKPTTDYGIRALGTGRAGLAICFAAGFHGAWQCRDAGRGIVVAMVAILIGFLVAIAGDVAAVFAIYAFHDLDLPHALYWALEVPLPVMLVLGGIVGTVGAAIAVGLARFRHKTVLQS
jgi:hypothetical protein